MKYEYDFENIPLPDVERRMVEMGLGQVDEISVKVKDILNRRAKDGWEPFYPFSVPLLWFKRPMKRTRKN